MIQEGNFKRVKYFFRQILQQVQIGYMLSKRKCLGWKVTSLWATHTIDIRQWTCFACKIWQKFLCDKYILMVYNISYEEFSCSAITYYLTWHHLLFAVCDHIRTEKPPIFNTQFRTAIVATASVSLFSCLVRYSGSADVSWKGEELSGTRVCGSGECAETLSPTTSNSSVQEARRASSWTSLCSCYM